VWSRPINFQCVEIEPSLLSTLVIEAQRYWQLLNDTPTYLMRLYILFKHGNISYCIQVSFFGVLRKRATEKFVKLHNKVQKWWTIKKASAGAWSLLHSAVRYLKLEHDNDTISGIMILNATALPELHMKRQSTRAIWCRVATSRVFSRPYHQSL